MIIISHIKIEKDWLLVSADKNIELQFSYIVGGNANGSATFENSLAVSYKVKHTHTLGPGFSLLGIWPREIKIHIHTKTGSESL